MVWMNAFVPVKKHQIGRNLRNGQKRSHERINLFADATLDHQWIHVDTERAKVDSPYHSTIAGFPV